MEENSKYTKLDIEENDKHIALYKFKPTSQIITAILVGLLFIASYSVVSYLWILGIIMVIFGVLVLYYFVDHKVLAFYQDYLINFDPKDDKFGQIIKYENIKEWKVKADTNSPSNGVMILLSNEEIVFIEMLRMFKVTRTLRDLMPEKEASKVQLSKMKNSPLKWPEKWGK